METMKAGDKKEIGSCKKPHGIKGGFSFFLFSGNESVLKKGMTITLLPLNVSSSIKEFGESFEVEKISYGNKIICILKGVSDRNLVEAMTPFSIYLERSAFPDLEDDEYYMADLLGLRAIDKDGNELGKVEDFYDNNAQTVLVIKGNHSFEVPLIENFVIEVDLDRGVLVINPPHII